MDVTDAVMSQVKAKVIEAEVTADKVVVQVLLLSTFDGTYR